MSYTQQLHQLQQIDSQIQASRRRLTEIATNLVESEALKRAKGAMSRAEVAFMETKTLMVDLELEVKGLQQKIAQNEKRLYSGRIASPKEASALQDEIASSKRWLAKREEDLLEAMIHHEEAEATRQREQETLTQVQKEWEADQSDLMQEQESLQHKIESLGKSRASVVQFIAEADLAIYERLRRKLGGVGLAEVEDRTCLSCGVMLSTRVVQQALADSRLHYCDSCRRIVHVL